MRDHPARNPNEQANHIVARTMCIAISDSIPYWVQRLVAYLENHVRPIRENPDASRLDSVARNDIFSAYICASLCRRQCFDIAVQLDAEIPCVHPFDIPLNSKCFRGHIASKAPVVSGSDCN